MVVVRDGKRLYRVIASENSLAALRKRFLEFYADTTDFNTFAAPALGKHLLACSESRHHRLAPAIYTCWLTTSFVSVELFSSLFNQSGILLRYCSARPEDIHLFNSLGTWEACEQNIEGGAAIPPFNKNMIQTVLNVFNSGVRKRKPYCRTALLPLSATYGVTMEMESLSFRGELFVTLPSKTGFYFYHEREFFAKSSSKVSHWKMSYGLFIWVNRDYLLKYPPPADVESCYIESVMSCCTSPSSAIFHWDAFDRALPVELRDAAVSIKRPLGAS